MADKVQIDVAKKVGGGYGKFWRSTKPFRVCKGGKGSKKSKTTALNFIIRIMQYPESNLLVIRQVMDTHRNSTFSDLRWAIRELGVENLWKCTASPMQMTYLPTGQRILFRGFDDVFKLASITVDKGYLCWVWIEEAFEISSEEDFEKLNMSVPRGAVPPHLFKQTTITFNPWSEKHWLKKRFFDNPSDDIDSFTTTYLCNEFLDEADIQRYERMKEENPRRYAVVGLGEWGMSEGLIFENWEVRDFDVQKLPEVWKYKFVFGLDYGYTNDPTAFIAAAVNPVDKLLYIYDEHYETRMLNNQIAAMIVGKGFSKERIRADSAEPKSNDELRRLGISRLINASKGPDSVRYGIDNIQQYRIIVRPCCENTIAELSSYIWAKNNDGTGKDKPVDKNNHLMDALRYAMEDVTFFRPVEPSVARHWQRQSDGGLLFRGGLTAEDFKGGWD